jgi:hypothetical protein
VIQQWDEILRLIATIKLKEVTASDLFRRLNSYSKQHALYQALKAFGRVSKSLFITLDALVNAAQDFSLAILLQIASVQSLTTPTVLAEKTISYAEAKTGLLRGLESSDGSGTNSFIPSSG